MNSILINIKEFEKTESLKARVTGIRIKEEALKKINENPESILLFNFDGIDLISTGFAKELFGGLLKELGKGEFFKRISIKIPSDNNMIKNIILRGLSSEAINSEEPKH